MAGAGQTTNTFTGNPANYSHEFQPRIETQNTNVNSQYNQYNADRTTAQEYENQYNTDFANRQNYGAFMDEAEGKYGVDSAKNAYQDSLRAVAATNQAMDALPSTVNANSGVVLNQAQRNAALGNQMNKYQNTLASWQQQNAVDQAALNVALQQAAQLAAGNYQSQQDALAAQMAQYQNAYANAQQTYQQAIAEQNILNDIYNQMYNDEYQHMQNEYQYWYGNMQDKWKQQEIAAQKYAADAGLRVQQYLAQLAKENEKKYKSWDFGNGYSIQEGKNGEAQYIKNGDPISAGQFLEGTGGTGTQWNLWNDIWNQGVSTRGVGSNTVDAYSKNMLPYYYSHDAQTGIFTPTGVMDQYKYLY